MKESAIRRAEMPRLRRSERIGEEIRIRTVGPAVAGILYLDFSGQIRHIGVAAADQRNILTLAELHRKTRGKATDAHDIPAVHQTFRPPWEYAAERKSPVIASDEI